MYIQRTSYLVFLLVFFCIGCSPMLQMIESAQRQPVVIRTVSKALNTLQETLVTTTTTSSTIELPVSESLTVTATETDLPQAITTTNIISDTGSDAITNDPNEATSPITDTADSVMAVPNQSICGQPFDEGYTAILSDKSMFRLPSDWSVRQTIKNGGSTLIANPSGIAMIFISPTAVEQLKQDELDPTNLAESVINWAYSHKEWQRGATQTYSTECSEMQRTDFAENNGSSQISVIQFEFPNGNQGIATAYFPRGDRDTKWDEVGQITRSFTQGGERISPTAFQTRIYFAQLEQYQYIFNEGSMSFLTSLPLAFAQQESGRVTVIGDNPSAVANAGALNDVASAQRTQNIAYLWTISQEQARQLIVDISVEKVKEVIKNTCDFGCNDYMALADQFEETGEPVHPIIVALGVMKMLGFGYERVDLEWSICMTCVATQVPVDDRGGVWLQELANGDFTALVYLNELEPLTAWWENLSWIITTASNDGMPNFTQEQRQVLGLPILVPGNAIVLDQIALPLSHTVTNVGRSYPAYIFAYPTGWTVLEESTEEVITEVLVGGGIDAVPVILENDSLDVNIAVYGPELEILPLLRPFLYTLQISGFVKDITLYNYENQLVTVYQMKRPLLGSTGVIAVNESSQMTLNGIVLADSNDVETIVAIAASIHEP